MYFYQTRPAAKLVGTWERQGNDPPATYEFRSDTKYEWVCDDCPRRRQIASYEVSGNRLFIETTKDPFGRLIAPFAINAREQILFRLELMAGSDWATRDDRAFMAIARSMRAAAIPAYERCRWPAQDASNRRWVDHTVALLKVHEQALGDRLAQVYSTRWAGLPYRIDVVESVPLGGNTKQFVPAGPHILVSSSEPSNQDRAALELVFHEAGHVLAGPTQEALKRAVSARGGAVGGDFTHALIFYLSGETVRRVLEQAGEPYTPWLHTLKLVPDNVRDALSRTLSPYVSGQGTLDQAIDNFVQALTEPAPGRKLDSSNDQRR